MITKEKLEKLYLSKNNKEVCKELGITNVTLVSYLKKFGIKLKGKGNRKKKGKTKLQLVFDKKK